MKANSDKETLFIRNFIVPRMCERLIFELGNPQKRRHAIGRFCHSAEDLIKPGVIHRKDCKLSKDDILQICTEIKANIGICYVISYDQGMDATETLFENALNNCIGQGMPSIIILDAKNAVIDTEQSFGPATKYILHVK